MFVRKKKNRSDTTSVVVVDKRGGRYRELKTIGVSSDEKEITVPYHEDKKWIDLRKSLISLSKKIQYQTIREMKENFHHIGIAKL